MAISANRLELLQIARSVAAEKNIDERVVVEAIEGAIQKAALSRYGAIHDIVAKIDTKSGELTITRRQTVVPTRDDVYNEAQQIALEDAQKIDPNVNVGHVFTEKLPLFDFGRVMSLTGKQVITQKVREAERNKQYEECKDLVGEITSGTVKRIEYGNVFVELRHGKGEGVIRRDQLLPRENFKAGDNVNVYIYEVRSEIKGPQVFLSRTHPSFMAKLFNKAVPEIYDGIIEVKAVARDPGSRAKIAVFTSDNSIDPVGACVGVRGSRVQEVVNELGGEKIDIIPWSPDPATFIVNALQPAEVTKVVLDEDETRVEVVVPEDQLSLAIGRRGQNVRLATQLTGWSIDIMTEEQEKTRREKETTILVNLFVDALEVDDMMARLLVSEGFESIEDLANTDLEDLVSIEGFDDEVAEELQARAKDHLEREAKQIEDKLTSLGVEPALLDIEGITPQIAIALGEGDVKTVEDLAGMVSDDLRGWFDIKNGQRVKQPGILEKFELTAQQADDLIMAARIIMGWVEAPEAKEAATNTDGQK